MSAAARPCSSSCTSAIGSSTRRNASSPPLEAVANEVAAELLGTLPQRALAPVVELDLDGIVHVRAEDLLELKCEVRAEDHRVRFVIVQEAQVVEIAAA